MRDRLPRKVSGAIAVVGICLLSAPTSGAQTTSSTSSTSSTLPSACFAVALPNPVVNGQEFDLVVSGLLAGEAVGIDWAWPFADWASPPPSPGGGTLVPFGGLTADADGFAAWQGTFPIQIEGDLLPYSDDAYVVSFVVNNTSEGSPCGGTIVGFLPSEVSTTTSATGTVPTTSPPAVSVNPSFTG